jgi:hypothetical protein
LHIDEGHSLRFAAKSFLLFDSDGQRIGTGKLRDDAANRPYNDDEPVDYIGAKDTSAPAFARALSSMEGWRRKFAVVELPVLAVDRFALEMPSIAIDGKEMPMPRILFQKVTEDVCRLSV